jgi:hypothetical protein
MLAKKMLLAIMRKIITSNTNTFLLFEIANKLSKNSIKLKKYWYKLGIKNESHSKTYLRFSKRE